MKLEIFLAAAFATTLVGLGTWSWYYGKSPLAPDAPPAPLEKKIEVPLPPPSAMPWDDDKAIARKDDMLERCHMAGGIPVMGFGWRVVCLAPTSALWWGDPKLSEDKK